MALKPELRRLRVLGCEAGRTRVTLHMADDSPIDLARLVVLINKEKGRLKLTPDRKLSARFDEQGEGDAIDRVQAFVRELAALELREPSQR
jgi:transcription-repair coupling factor (superfamily II helicase)